MRIRHERYMRHEKQRHILSCTPPSFPGYHNPHYKTQLWDLHLQYRPRQDYQRQQHNRHFLSNDLPNDFP